MILKQTAMEEFLALLDQARQQGKKMVPVCLEILGDNLTPVLAYMTLKRDGVPSFLYESVVGGERMARYSFLGVKPFQVFTYQKGRVRIVDQNGQLLHETTDDPRQVMAAELERYSMLPIPGLPPFCGGMVGNIGYDAVRLVEPRIKDKNTDDLGLPDISLMYFDVVIAFDHVEGKISLIKLVSVNGETNQNYDKAIAQLTEIHEQLLRPRFLDLVAGTPINGVSSNLSREEFEAMVLRCKEYITAGDIVQVVVSQRFSCKLSVDPFIVYRCLRHKNPAPYLFFLDFGHWQLIGSSPEILVNVKDRQVTICPIAGTRPRGKDEAEDAALEAELLADEKERAEHLMLLDLARNDVGRVAKFGTVKVLRQFFIDRYATVMHIVSEVVGQLRDDLSPLDALWACLQAGTLTGAPKIRAMEIIEELEKIRRGPYGGCVGFFGFDGNIETAIVIRTAIALAGFIYWQAGAGIVYDSDPTREYEETLHKARSILRALIMAGNTRAA